MNVNEQLPEGIWKQHLFTNILMSSGLKINRKFKIMLVLSGENFKQLLVYDLK